MYTTGGPLSLLIGQRASCVCEQQIHCRPRFRQENKSETDVADSPPISAADYYDFFPPSDHRVGDIWVDLPTFGMLPLEHVTGIVITPACDLQNCKAETITYLPVIPIRLAFSLTGFLPVIIRAINGQAQVCRVDGLDDTELFVRPDSRAIEALEARIKNGRFSNDKEKVAADRVMAGAAILRAGSGRAVQSACGNQLKTLLGASTLRSTVEKLVRNSYKGDMHFLPGDGQRMEWSAIPEPSVALFRHVFSVPIEVFDRAQIGGPQTEWQRDIETLVSRIAGAASFSKRPMKRQTLRPRFAADLLTRYAAMHVRLGAPDFTDMSISGYVAQVVGDNE